MGDKIYTLSRTYCFTLPFTGCLVLCDHFGIYILKIYKYRDVINIFGAGEKTADLCYCKNVRYYIICHNRGLST